MYIFGIDIGGTSVKIGLFQDKGNLVEHWQISTHPNQLLTELVDSIKEHLSSHNITFDDVYGYGIGVPGIMKDGIALSCVNLGWHNVDVKQEFRNAIGYDANVYVFNDANIAAYGEAAYADLKYESVVLVTLGTGVGGGIILNHEIVEGANGLGGEIGHMCMDDTYHFPCSCGKTGCLETLVSATGIINLVKFYQGKIPSNLEIIESLTAKDVIDAAKKKDQLASFVVNEACRILAKALASIAVVLNPDAFIIGGGLSNAGSFLLEEIRKNYLEVCIEQAKSIKINLAVLKNNAGIYGACAYLIQKKQEVERNGKC